MRVTVEEELLLLDALGEEDVTKASVPMTTMIIAATMITVVLLASLARLKPILWLVPQLLINSYVRTQGLADEGRRQGCASSFLNWTILESRTISKLRASGLLSESRRIALFSVGIILSKSWASALSSAVDELIFRSSGLRRLPSQATWRSLGPRGTTPSGLT